MNKVKYKAVVTIIIALLISVSFFSCGAKKEYKNIGDVIKLSDCEITIEKVEKYDSVEYIEPKEGNTFIAIKFKYKNISEETLEYQSLPIIDLLTEEGESYTINYDASNVYALLQGVDYSIMTDALESEAERNDAEVYEIPADDIGSKEIVIKVDNTNYYIKVENLNESDGAA